MSNVSKLVECFDNPTARAIWFSFRSRTVVIMRGRVKTLDSGLAITVSDKGIQKILNNLNEVTNIEYSDIFTASDYLTVEEYKQELAVFVKEGIRHTTEKTSGYIVGMFVEYPYKAW